MLKIYSNKLKQEYLDKNLIILFFVYSLLPLVLTLFIAV